MLHAGMRLGPYEITGPLGAGGMGEVYRARDTRLNRVVALKVLRGDVTPDAEARARFEREARAIAALSHPHICTLHDVGREQDVDYLVMELIEGRSLADHVRGVPLELSDALAFAIQIADALAAAHRQGIVHRDLKPGNIMLARPSAGSSSRPHVKLLDFGLARLRVEPAVTDTAVTSPITAEGTIIGTVHYMAPEQLTGQPYDTRIDIFAFGAILFEMITGRRAFDGASTASVAAAVLHTTPPPITVDLPAAPPALERLVATCLAKDPDHRWSSMHDVRLQLGAISLDERVETTQPTPPTRRAPAKALTWAAAALVALLGTAAWLVSRPTAVTPPARSPDLLSILPAPGATPSYAWEAPQVSPDGRHVAFASSDASGTVWLYVRSRDVLEPRRLPGTEEANLPFWSPDSTRLAFFAAGQLKTVGLDGAAPRVLARRRSHAAARGARMMSFCSRRYPTARRSSCPPPAASHGRHPSTDPSADSDRSRNCCPTAAATSSRGSTRSRVPRPVCSWRRSTTQKSARS